MLANHSLLSRTSETFSYEPWFLSYKKVPKRYLPSINIMISAQRRTFLPLYGHVEAFWPIWCKVHHKINAKIVPCCFHDIGVPNVSHNFFFWQKNSHYLQMINVVSLGPVSLALCLSPAGCSYDSVKDCIE